MGSATKNVKEGAVVAVLLGLSFCHMLNDMLQSLILAIYPLLKESFHLDFGQIGLITLVFQMTASLLQPLIGHYTDKNPKPYALAVGMGFTLTGLLLLASASSFPAVLLAAAMVGMGSSIFHPESSRIARLASGGQHGFAQSFFQVGGNLGTSIGPLLAAFIIVPRGQGSIAWFSLAALLAMIVLANIGGWYKRQHITGKTRAKEVTHSTLSRRKIILSIAILIILIFSKMFYLSSINSYYMFYLINKFHISLQSAQIHLFIFLGAVAAGTLAGGPIGDRIGRKYVIWGSILGVLPFTLALPYADLFWTGVLSAIIGVILASAFSAILVYATELVPGRVGMIAGLFFGLAFGMAGIGAAVLGKLADVTSIDTVYHICSFLPLIGLLTGFLPNVEKRRHE